MLKLRVITALLLIPLVMAAVFCLSRPYFMGITALVTLLAAWEWSRLCGWIDLKKRFLYVGFQWATLLFLTEFPVRRWMVTLGLIVWLLLSVYLLWARAQLTLPAIPVYVRASLGWLILTLCWVALQVLHLTPWYLLFMLLVIWLADTAAYASGRLWGQHLLAPTLSPKKTWEGFIISLLLTFVVVMLAQFYWSGSKPLLWQIFFLVLCTSFAAVAGDLFESQLKRLEGLKDSGCLLPGHGGILDRIDSLLAAAPVFAGSLLLLGLT